MNQDRGLFLSIACVLLGFGVLMVYSASITSWPSEFEHIYLSRHVTFLSIGVVVATIAAVLPARFWRTAAPWLFTLTAALLILVLIPGLGTKVNGAQRWFRFGSLSFQPSELAKIALPLFVCRLATDRRDRLRHWLHGTVPILLPALLVVLLVMVQPDLGTALFLAGGTGIALFAAGWPLRNFLVSAVAGIPAVVCLVVVRPYQLKRITGFLAVWTNPAHAPYQLRQSLISMGAGGLFGMGLGKGWQKLSFLPEANTDFVFAVVGEELGLIGTLSLVTLWIGLYIAGLRLLRHLDRNSFAAVAGFTLITQLILQAALNVAVVTAVVPTKGIPHPLLSYGGSNLVVSIVSLGIIISLSRTEPHDMPGHLDRNPRSPI